MRKRPSPRTSPGVSLAAAEKRRGARDLSEAEPCETYAERPRGARAQAECRKRSGPRLEEGRRDPRGGSGGDVHAGDTRRRGHQRWTRRERRDTGWRSRGRGGRARGSCAGDGQRDGEGRLARWGEARKKRCKEVYKRLLECATPISADEHSVRLLLHLGGFLTQLRYTYERRSREVGATRKTVRSRSRAI